MTSRLKPNETGKIIPLRPANPMVKSLDTDMVLTALNTVGYSWNLLDDTIEWGSNLTQLPDLSKLSTIVTGSDYTKHVISAKTSDRARVVLTSKSRDFGDGVPYTLSTRIALDDGEVITVKDKGRWFADKNGEPLYAKGLISMFAGETVEEQNNMVEDKSVSLSRTSLTISLQKAVKHAVTTRSSVGLILIAVDNLSRINDVYGFEIADKVIDSVADRLERLLRGGDILSRFTGNKIGVIMHRCNAAEMKIAAERFIEAVEDKSFPTAIGEVTTGITVGGAVAPDHAQTVDELIAYATDALRHARDKRRGSFEVYTPSEQREMLKRENARVTEDVIAALNARAMTLAFQPIVRAQSPRDTVYYECLLRLKRPDGTTIGTPAVMALAERLGLVRLIDKRILDLSVTEMQRSPELKLSINVTPASTIDDDWIDQLKSHCQDVPNLMERMIVEITETSAILDIDETKRFVRRVKDLGGRVAIDDFGAGYTSFRNLRLLGVDIVKLDGSFIENIENSTDDAHFVETLLNLANHMGLSTIAEWVQSERAAQKLADMGCHYLQGYYTGAASEKRPWL